MRELGILRIFIDYDLLLFQPHHVNGLQVMDESHERIGRWLGAREVCGHHFRPSFVRENDEQNGSSRNTGCGRPVEGAEKEGDSTSNGRELVK